MKGRTKLKDSLKDTIQSYLNAAFRDEWNAFIEEISQRMNVSMDLPAGLIRVSDSETASDYKLVHLRDVVNKFMAPGLDQESAKWARQIAGVLEKEAKRLRKWASKAK